MALKQLIPDNEVALLGGALKFRAKVRVWCGLSFRPGIGARVWLGVDPQCSAEAALTPAVARCACMRLPAQRCRIRPGGPGATQRRTRRTLPLLLQHLPGLYAVGASAGSLLVGGATRIIPFTLFGTYFAWGFLRFVQTRNGVRCARREQGRRGGEEGGWAGAAAGRGACQEKLGAAATATCALLCFWQGLGCLASLLRRLRRGADPQPFAALPACRRGDLSDEFRLASFLPALLQPPVDRLAGACTRLTGLGGAASSQQQQAAWRSALVGGGALPGSLDVADDAARRRWGGAPGCALLGRLLNVAWGPYCLGPLRVRRAQHGCSVLSSPPCTACLTCARASSPPCRERGAKALEERLGLKKAASATSVPAAVPAAAAAAPASSGGAAAAAPKAAASKPASPVPAPAPAAAPANEPDLEAGTADEEA